MLDGASRAEAAKIGGMDRQTLRDWVIRFNEQGPDGLINIPWPGLSPKLDAAHRPFSLGIVEDGPMPAIHGVVRWRACDLIMRLEEFRISVSDDTIYSRAQEGAYRTLRARPQGLQAENPRPWRRSKKTSPPCGWNPRRPPHRHPR